MMNTCTVMTPSESPKYVIHKASRMPHEISYSGPTWDRAGLRAYYREQYTNKEEAENLAWLLSDYNGDGFQVSIAKVHQYLRFLSDPE